MSLCRAIGLSLLAFLASVGLARTAEPLSIKTLKTRLAAKPTGEDARSLATELRTWFGKDRAGHPAMQSGANPKIDGLETAWAIEAPGAEKVAIVTSDSRTLPLSRSARRTSSPRLTRSPRERRFAGPMWSTAAGR